VTQVRRRATRLRPDYGAAPTPRAVIGGLLAADVAFAYQQTAIVPAIHDVERSLVASPEWSAWLVTVYLIVATIATPAMAGWPACTGGGGCCWPASPCS
jgi:hypothetical protein